ncbi:MAG: BT_3928 family protein [Anditalea sp.]
MIKQILLTLTRFIVGGLFIFSGLIKVNDPVGTSIKLEEYFDVFSYDIAPFFAYFKEISLSLAVILVVLEVVLGVMLILGVKLRLTVILLSLMILFFTFLTFYSAYFNKVTDCGCFGDAIKLTPWESFYKDVFLLVLISLLFIFRNHLPTSSSPWLKGIALLSFLVSFALAIMAIRNLPFIDFRAYKEGVHIPSAMQPSEPLEYSYRMEKEGKETIFDQYPSDDSYEFVDMELKNPEALPKISDFAVWNEQGDFTEEIISGNKLLVLISNISKMSEDNLDLLTDLINQLEGSDIEPVVIAASSEEEIKNLLVNQGWDISYYLADATVVKTIIRSNPGILLLKDGTVLKKYHHNNTPLFSEVEPVFRHE